MDQKIENGSQKSKFWPRKLKKKKMAERLILNLIFGINYFGVISVTLKLILALVDLESLKYNSAIEHLKN